MANDRKFSRISSLSHQLAFGYDSDLDVCCTSRRFCSRKSDLLLYIDKVISELRPVFEDVFDRDDIDMIPSLTAADVPEWDSLSNIRLFVAIETKFGVRFTSDEITSLKNLGELAELLERKRG